ncbi:hypothetical protein Tco_1268769 [Tanacetum coccineum]
MEEINNFQKEPDENLYQAWERFKELLMKLLQTLKRPSKKWQNTLINGTMEHLEEEALRLLTDWLLYNTTEQSRKRDQEGDEKVYATLVGCEQYKGPYYTKDCPLTEEGKTLEESYCTQFGEPFQGGGYRATTPGFYQRNNANPSYQERRQSMEDTLSKFMGESAKRHEENSNLIKEI